MQPNDTQQNQNINDYTNSQTTGNQNGVQQPQDPNMNQETATVPTTPNAMQGNNVLDQTPVSNTPIQTNIQNQTVLEPAQTPQVSPPSFDNMSTGVANVQNESPAQTPQQEQAQEVQTQTPMPQNQPVMQPTPQNQPVMQPTPQNQTQTMQPQAPTPQTPPAMPATLQNQTQEVQTQMQMPQNQQEIPVTPQREQTQSTQPQAPQSQPNQGLQITQDTPKEQNISMLGSGSFSLSPESGPIVKAPEASSAETLNNVEVAKPAETVQSAETQPKIEAPKPIGAPTPASDGPKDVSAYIKNETPVPNHEVVVDMRTNHEPLSHIENAEDPLTENADKQEEEFIEEVEKHHAS